MTASISTNGDQRTITFEYTTHMDKVDATLEAAAEALYNQSSMFDPAVPFANLTNQQKLDLLDDFVKEAVRRKARQHIVSQTVEVANMSINATVDDTIL